MWSGGIKVSKSKLRLPLLGLTLTSLASTLLTNRVIANEINFNSVTTNDTQNQTLETTQTQKITTNSTAPELLDNTFSSDVAPIPKEISYQAADLQISSNLKSTSNTTNNTSGWAITPEIGTLGIGASVTK